MSTDSIKDIVGQYATPYYDGVEIEEDKSWTSDDLNALQEAIRVEQNKRIKHYIDTKITSDSRLGQLTGDPYRDSRWLW